MPPFLGLSRLHIYFCEILHKQDLHILADAALYSPVVAHSTYTVTMPPPPPARKESLSVASKPRPPVRSASLSKPVPASLEELPPPPANLLETPREVAEEEYERLVQEKGLLGALGFDAEESETDPAPVVTPTSKPKASLGQASAPAAAMAAAAASIAQKAALRQSTNPSAGAKAAPAKPPAPARTTSKSQSPLKTASEALSKPAFKKPTPPGRQTKTGSKPVPKPAMAKQPVTRRPKLSFSTDPAEVVSTYAPDEYSRANSGLDVDKASLEADTEEAAEGLREVMEDTHDFFDITVQGKDLSIPYTPLELSCIEADDDVRFCGVALGSMSPDHVLRKTHNCAPGDVVVRVNDTQTLVTTEAKAAALLAPDTGHADTIVLELARSFDAVADDAFLEPEPEAPVAPTARAKPVPARRDRSNSNVKTADASVALSNSPSEAAGKTKPAGKSKVPPTRPRAPTGSKLVRSASVDPGATRTSPSKPESPLKTQAKASPDLQAQLVAKESALNSRSQQLLAVQAELAETKTDRGRLQTQVDDLSQQVAQLSSQVEDLSSHEADEAAVLQTALTGASSRIETLEASLAESEAALVQKEEELRVQQAEGMAPEAATAMATEHAAKTARLEKQLDKANKIIQNLAKEKEELTVQLASQEADSSDQQAEDAKVLEAKVAELAVQLETSQSQLQTVSDKAKADLARYTQTQAEQAAEIAALQAHVETLEAQENQTKMALATAEARVAAMEAELASVHAQAVSKGSVVKETAAKPKPKPVTTKPPAVTAAPTAIARKPKPERPVPPGSPTPTPKPRPKPATRPSASAGSKPSTSPSATSAGAPKDANAAAAMLHAALMGSSSKPKTPSSPVAKAASTPTDSSLDDVFGALPTAPTLNNAAGRSRAASASRAKVKRRPPTRHTQRPRSTSPKLEESKATSSPEPVPELGSSLESSAADVTLRPKLKRGDSSTEDDGTAKRRSKFGAIGAGLKKLRRKSGAVAFSADNPPPAASWTATEVGEWLATTGIASVDSVVEAFKDANVDGETLLTLTTADSLKSLGVSSIGQRTLLKKKILDLNKQES
eukprot:m.177069 g.177069  ORF g.177069 m.177069 type:complete len:1071 (-) comp16808_c0_seq1:28-3240(-)